MTFDQLQYFVAVVESSTFFDAAESLHIAQSTLSKQIRNLELELDVQLFDRSRRHASLTEAGRALYPDAVKLLKGIQGMKQHLAPYQDSRKSIIHLGVLPILHQYRLNPILKQFTESHPEISLLIDEVEDEPLRQGFRHGSYDLVIGRPELLTGIQSTCHLLARDQLVLLTPTDHPLAGSRSSGRTVRRIVYSDASRQQHPPAVSHGMSKKRIPARCHPDSQDRIHCQRRRRRRGGEPASLQQFRCIPP